MNPGSLNERIILKYPTSSSIDKYGQSVMVYASQSLWSGVRRQGGGETNANGYIVNTATYVFTLRENDNITEKGIITFEGNDYNIVYLDKNPFAGYTKATGERRN